jgi:hypothetical protein
LKRKAPASRSFMLLLAEGINKKDEKYNFFNNSVASFLYWKNRQQKK